MGKPPALECPAHPPPQCRGIATGRSAWVSSGRIAQTQSGIDLKPLWAGWQGDREAGIGLSRGSRLDNVQKWNAFATHDVQHRSLLVVVEVPSGRRDENIGIV